MPLQLLAQIYGMGTLTELSVIPCSITGRENAYLGNEEVICSITYYMTTSALSEFLSHTALGLHKPSRRGDTQTPKFHFLA